MYHFGDFNVFITKHKYAFPHLLNINSNILYIMYFLPERFWRSVHMRALRTTRTCFLNVNSFESYLVFVKVKALVQQWENT